MLLRPESIVDGLCNNTVQLDRVTNYSWSGRYSFKDVALRTLQTFQEQKKNQKTNLKKNQ